MSMINFMLSLVEHEKSFITLAPDFFDAQADLCLCDATTKTDLLTVSGSFYLETK